MAEQLHIIGIDAINIRAGGGITHLAELLRALKPTDHNILKLVVWAEPTTLALLPDRKWMDKIAISERWNFGLLSRLFWQLFKFTSAAKKFGCTVLFVPGGLYFGGFKPVVTMSQNLLPFEIKEIKRFGISAKALKLLALRFLQIKTFKKSSGIIFLTSYSKKIVFNVAGELKAKCIVIPHGLSQAFLKDPKIQKSIQKYTFADPLKILYVSIIDQYKHQCELVEAIYHLRQLGYPITLELIGPAYGPALLSLKIITSRLDPESCWINYSGQIRHEEINKFYESADLGVFASSCEAFGIILLELMGSGLPIACSRQGALQEILGDDGVYFDPTLPTSIASALQTLIDSESVREEKSRASHNRAKQFLWDRCAFDTFTFIASVAKLGAD